MTTFVVANIPRISQEYFDRIENRCPKLIIEPGMSQDTIMYLAGMHKVLEFIRETIGSTPNAQINREIT